MYKYTQPQNDNIKNIKKPKEIKLLTNYIPVKKTHFQSNISEYETEPSIQKNFSNKCPKNKQMTQAKSVQTNHKNQFSPKKIFTQNSKRNYSNASQSSKGSLYNWNNLNIYDYFSEKVIVTQKKYIVQSKNGSGGSGTLVFSNDSQKTQLDDGVLYSKDGKQVEADFVMGDEYYDTTINDMWLNYEEYKNQKIQIEGMYLENSMLTFVGRYSTSSLCPNCPAGYSVMEYQLDGLLDQTLQNEKSWIKIVATLEKGIDEGSTMEYLYLKVITLEVMNESGKKTVSN